MIPLGFAGGCGILVGNSIGEKKPKLAMQFYRVALVTAGAITVVQIIALYFAEQSIQKIFTD